MTTKYFRRFAAMAVAAAALLFVPFALMLSALTALPILAAGVGMGRLEKSDPGVRNTHDLLTLLS